MHDYRNEGETPMEDCAQGILAYPTDHTKFPIHTEQISVCSVINLQQIVLRKKNLNKSNGF